MKKILLLSAFLACSHFASSQITIFEDSFETYQDFAITDVGAWTLTDVDLKNTYGFNGVTFPNTGVAKSFQVFNSTATTPPLTPSATSNWTARTGVRNMVCFAASTPAPSVNNDWLISPQIQLGSAGNELTFWAKSCDVSFGLERFRVGVSTTGTAPADFTIITPEPYVVNPPTATYIQYTYPLDAYQGQQVYIGINCVSNDQFGFAIDDFKVTATTLATEAFFSQNFAFYPNPAADILNINSKTNVAINEIKITDLNGRTVKTVKNAGLSVAEINVGDLSSGLYILNVVSDSGSGSVKFVKN